MDSSVLPVEIAPGLFRWTAAHPQWERDPEPGSVEDWDLEVGSVLYELPHTVVLIDPLLPRERREDFLAWLDRRVGETPVSILTTIRWHRRSREELAGRYRQNSARAWNLLPPGVEERPLRGAGETLFWLSAVRALVAGDRLVGDGQGGLALCPESWLEDVAVDRAGLARLMGPLLELPIERVLPSHGGPVLHDGRAALARALAQAASG